MYAAATPLVGPGPAARRRRHRRRPVDVGQHLHDGRDRGRRRRRPRGQARQPLGLVEVRLRRRARGARHPARPAAPSGWPRSPSEAGITFCFAAAFHPALRHAAVPRRELGIGTTFNFLGPLANPARPGAQAIGCADRADGAGDGRRASPRRGVDAWVFRGDDGLDELTTTTTSSVWRVHGGEVTEHDRRPGRARPRRGRPPRTCAAATRRTTPRWSAACWPASRARCATPCCSTPAPRSRCYDAPGGPVDERAGRRAGPGRRGRRLRRGPGRARALGRGDLRAEPVRARAPDVRTSRAVAAEAEPVVVGADHAGGVTTRRKPWSRSTPLRRQTNSPGEKSRKRGVT